MQMWDVMQCDPGANKRMLVRRVKACIVEKETAKRLEHAKSRKHQGQLLSETEDEVAGIWSSVVLQLPPQVFRFSMNAAQDTLPHNTNLSLWKKCDSLNDACRLCGRRQTLAHVLNQCPTSLHPNRTSLPAIVCWQTSHQLHPTPSLPTSPSLASALT